MISRVAQSNAAVEEYDYSDELEEEEDEEDEEEEEEEASAELDTSGRLIQPASYNRSLIDLYSARLLRYPANR